MSNEEVRWRHCVIDPPTPGDNYLILEIMDNGAWRHTVDHYQDDINDEHFWISGHDRHKSWWVEIPLPYPQVTLRIKNGKYEPV